MNTFKICLSVANELGLAVYQMDVKGAFLYGEINENVFMRLPDGIKSESNVCKL